MKFKLDTYNAGNDEILTGDSIEEVTQDVLNRYEIDALPSDWEITSIESDDYTLTEDRTMKTYKIISIKHSETVNGSLAEAVERAMVINDQYAPSYGTQVECAGTCLFDTEDSADALLERVDATAVMDVLDAAGYPKTQDWENEATTWDLPDGSQICCCCGEAFVVTESDR